jgi:hypothetical protein
MLAETEAFTRRPIIFMVTTPAPAGYSCLTPCDLLTPSPDGRSPGELLEEFGVQKHHA